MCSYRTLYYNDNIGYVVFCEHCQRLQMGFGCILLHFHPEEFTSFIRVISELKDEYEDMLICETKFIIIPTPCESLSLFLSPAQVGLLHAMIEEADTNLTVSNMLSLF